MRHDQPYNRGCPVFFNNDIRTNDEKQAFDTPIERDVQETQAYEYAHQQNETEVQFMPRSRNDHDDPCDQGTAGMVYHAPHGLRRLYDPYNALRFGTLFDELNKPMDDCAEETEPAATRQQAHAFAAWEMRLYLCTHPGNRQALNLYRQFCQQTEQPNYACTFAPGTAGKGTWDWVDDPWPWEYAAHCDRRG